MTPERLFSEEELADMGAASAELVQKAIDNGDYEKAKKLVRRMNREFLSIHDLFRDWVTALLTFIGRRYGDEVLYEAQAAGCEVWLKPMAEYCSQAEPKQRIEALVAGVRGHLFPFKIEEDDEKFSFSPGICPTGGRLIVDGGYAPPRDLLRITEAQPMTYGKTDFPVYCAHCYFQDLLPNEWTGQPLYVTEPAAKPGHQACRLHVYKNQAAVPASYYERIGKPKPISTETGEDVG